MDKRYLGTISKARGYNGEMKLSDIPSFLPKLKDGCDIFIGFSEKFAQKYTLSKWNPSTSKATITLKEISNEKDAHTIKEQGVFVNEADCIVDPEMEEMEALIGCIVYDSETKEEVGEIIEYWDMPANNVWLVATDEGDLPIPEIEEVIQSVDLEKGEVYVNMIEGLADLTNNLDYDEEEYDEE